MQYSSVLFHTLVYYITVYYNSIHGMYSPMCRTDYELSLDYQTKVRRNTHGHRLPMTPSGGEILQYIKQQMYLLFVFITAALKAFKDKLTPYEKEEILEYPEVWFLGLEAKKIEAVPGASQNSGFDDENGNYIKMLYDHLAYRYEILEVIGKGSFGQVVKVCTIY